MKFLNLAAWPLLGIIPLIVLLYFLKLKRERQIVPSLFLWQKLVQDRQANSLFQRLRRNLLLILQILFLLLLIFALLRPYLPSLLAPGSVYLVLIDSSASMRTMEKGRTRFTAAKELIQELISNLKQGDRMLIVSCSNKVEKLSGLTSNKQKLRQFTSLLNAHTATTDLSPALSLLSAAAKGSKSASLFIFTDGNTPPIPARFAFPGKIYVKKMGTQIENVGFTGFSLRKIEQENQISAQCFLEVKNFGKQSKEVSIAQMADGKQIDLITLTLAAGKSRAKIIPINHLWKKLSFKLLKNDAYAVDNQVFAILHGKEKKKVSVFTSDPQFLGHLLMSYPNTEVKFYAPVPEDFDFRKKPSDLLILDNTPVKTLPPYPTFFIGITPAGTGKQSRELAFQVSDWDQKHPLNKFVPWDKVLWSRYNTELKLPDWGVPLLEIGNTPIVWAGKNKGLKYLSWEFSLDETDLPLHAAFVFAIVNALDWFYKTPIDPYLNLTAGFTVPKLPLYEKAMLKGKSGKRKILIGSTLPVREPGIYEISGNKGMRRYIAVNFLSSRESNIAPCKIRGLKAREGKEQARKIVSHSEWWPIIALFALLALFIEWFVFTRWRKPVEIVNHVRERL